MLQLGEGSMQEEAPRERAEKYGVGVLSNAELWALILRTGMPNLPITTLTASMMKENDNSLLTLERRSREEILDLQGIGMVKAVQIEAVYEIAKRYFRESPAIRTQIKSSKDIYDQMMDIANLPHEEIWAIYLRRNNTVISRKRITTGSATASLFDLKAVLRNALLEKAEGLILCHNHPSGNLRPSEPDRRITQRTAEASRQLDVNFLDHLIVTSHGYYSFRDEGELS